MPTEVPPARIAKMQAWRRWSAFWNWVYYTTTVSTALLTATVAANAKAKFLSDNQATLMGIIAAALAALVPVLGAQARGAAFETAARELEKAITLYNGDDSMLAQAEARGIDILNRLKSN